MPETVAPIRDPAALKEALRSFALGAGLDRVGVASAEAFLVEQERLERRKAAGLGPNPFEVQEIAQRVYPQQALPGARSIVAAAMSYLVPDEPEDAEGLRGWLSRYCRGLDYHQVLEERLEQVAAWLRQQVRGARTLVHVDVGAPLDRAVAERAGIGRFGKSTNLIVPRLGTWVFLGEIYTDVPLPPDAPASFQTCGSCTRCLDACPTGCIGEWEIDSTRCLGYVTQMDGPVPTEYRELLGSRLFGCDDCQDVCPYNARPVAGLHPEFAPLPGIGARPHLGGLLALDGPGFHSLYGPTAAAWRGLEPLQRNALIALGNSGDPAAFDLLVDGLTHPSPLLRGHAAWGLGRLAKLVPAIAASAKAALRSRLAVEEDADVRAEISAALGRVRA